MVEVVEREGATAGDDGLPVSAPRTPYAPEVPRVATEAPASAPEAGGSLSEARLVDAELSGRRVAGLG